MSTMAQKLFQNDAMQRAYRTFWMAGVPLFLVSLMSWLQDVATWSTGGDDAVFPSVSVLGKAAISATVAALIALFSWIWNALEDKTGVSAPTLGK